MMETDVLVAGGGIAGLTAAARLAHAGLSVTLCDPTPVVQSRDAGGADLRSTAFLQPARQLFEDCGLWEALAPHATPLQSLRIIDSAGDPPDIKTSRTFEAADLGDQPFGWNIPNWRSRAVLVERLTHETHVDLRLGASLTSLLTRTTEAIATLDDGARITARMIIGADGRDSQVRKAHGIGVTTWRYGQKALAFVVTHDLPHHHISTEIYRDGGAFTLVPLPDAEDRPASAVVWMDHARASMDRAAQTHEEIAQDATERSCHVLGRLQLISNVGVFPIVTQTARAMTAERTILLAEAAHVLPPIGAQGLNTSLADVTTLGDLAQTMPERLGQPDFLAAFVKARGRDVAARAHAIDAFNRICRTDHPAAQAVRQRGLHILHDIKPLRERVMQAGLGV